MTMATIAHKGPVAPEQVMAMQQRQAFYAAASRHLGQIAGVILLLLADRQPRHLEQHLPALRTSALHLREHLDTADFSRTDFTVLDAVRQRLAVVLTWLQKSHAVETLSDREIDACLSELQQVRHHLLTAGQESCQFSMVHFAAGCCCGQHGMEPAAISTVMDMRA